MTSLSHILIAIVALIECLVLLSFTTYSWIESSSSLIISSGKNGSIEMKVARALNYQVTVSLDAAGNVDLNENSVDDGYYRTVRYFNYAKASSADGKTMYFPRLDSTGAVTAYRLGDTADYNTSYTYLDFVLKNTTQTTKQFYFNTADIFSYSNESDTSDTYKSIILGAMRISFQKGTASPVIYSIAGAQTAAISGTTTSSTTSVTPLKISTHVYDETLVKNGTNTSIFDSIGQGVESVEDNISVRIWFDCQDPTYLTNKSAVDAVLPAAQIKAEFNLISDNVAYDQIYFDDYAFSNIALGSHVTEETSSYGMYFHAYNSKLASYVNYAMSTMTNTANDATRWVTSLPIQYVVSPLTDSTSTYFQNAYFYYGSADGNTIAYKWTLPGALGITTADHTDENAKITDATKYIRNLGVVRDASTKTGTVVGFAQFDSSSDPATLVYFRDRATAFTGTSYNLNSLTAMNYGYITDTIGYVDLSGSSSTSYENICYANVPSDTTKIVINNGSSGDGNQSYNLDITDGICYYSPTTSTGDWAQYTSVSLPTASELNLSDVKRVYFYNTFGWSTVKVYCMNDSLSGVGGETFGQWPGGDMKLYSGDSVSTEDPSRSYNIYINQTATSANQNTTAKQTVGMYYDASASIFKAYVPASWLTSSLYFHYNTNGYYVDTSDTIRWNSTSASLGSDSTYTYTALGYTDSEVLSSLTGGTGVGTWGDVRLVKFSTELIDRDISSAYAYKLGFSSGTFADYPMIPDDTGITFSAYVPSSVVSTDGAVRFTRYASQTSSTVTAYWYTTAFGDDDVTYYAKDITATDATGERGWFHVAVLVDGTYENLIYDTVLDLDRTDTDYPAAGAYLAYSFDNADYTTIASVSYSGGTYSYTDDYRIEDDTRRWVIPINSNTTVYWKWVPYPASSENNNVETSFTYTQSIGDGIYYVITEAS